MQYNAAQDFPDSRDILAEELFGESSTLFPVRPPSVILDITKPLNQWSVGACTVFGSSGALFETEAQAADAVNADYVEPYDPWSVWKEAKKRGASDTAGWYIQSAIQLLKDLHHSNGYTRVGNSGAADLETLKNWIAKGRAITTGTAKGNWGLIMTTGVYSEQSADAGHCFQLNGYDDSHVFPSGEVGWFHSPNSWDGRGAFWLPYSMAGRLYSQYVQLESEDLGALSLFKFRKREQYIALATRSGIWNGSRGNDIATAEEVRIMLGRGADLLGGQKRRIWADKIVSNVIRGKYDVTFWSGKDAEKTASDLEVCIMLERALLRNENFSWPTLTRETIAMAVARDFLT